MFDLSNQLVGIYKNIDFTNAVSINLMKVIYIL